MARIILKGNGAQIRSVASAMTISDTSTIGYLRAELKLVREQNRRLHSRIRQLYIAICRGDFKDGIHLQSSNNRGIGK